MGRNRKARKNTRKSPKKLLSSHLKCLPQIPNPFHFIMFGCMVTLCFVLVFANDKGPLKPKASFILDG